MQAVPIKKCTSTQVAVKLLEPSLAMAGTRPYCYHGNNFEIIYT